MKLQSNCNKPNSIETLNDLTEISSSSIKLLPDVSEILKITTEIFDEIKNEYTKILRIDTELFDQTCNSSLSRRSIVVLAGGGGEEELYVGQTKQLSDLKSVLEKEFEKVRVFAVNQTVKILKRCASNKEDTENVGGDDGMKKMVLPAEYQKNVESCLQQFRTSNKMCREIQVGLF